MPGSLEEVREPSGPRHYLDGRPIHAGDTLELALFDDAASFDWAGRIKTPAAPKLPSPLPVWLRGRYEWSFQPKDEPLFYLELGDGRPLGAGHCVGLAKLELPKTAVLRWPAQPGGL